MYYTGFHWRAVAEMVAVRFLLRLMRNVIVEPSKPFQFISHEKSMNHMHSLVPLLQKNILHKRVYTSLWSWKTDWSGYVLLIVNLQIGKTGYVLSVVNLQGRKTRCVLPVVNLQSWKMGCVFSIANMQSRKMGYVLSLVKLHGEKWGLFFCLCILWYFVLPPLYRVCWQSALRRCFWQKIPACRVKNARKVSNLAVLFSLHSGIFYSKNRLASWMSTDPRNPDARREPDHRRRWRALRICVRR